MLPNLIGFFESGLAKGQPHKCQQRTLGSSTMALTVTFDTNTLASVISPQAAQRDTGMSGAAVRTAIQDGRILGFFCETLVTLEGIETKDRVDILGNTRVISEATSTDRNAITLTVGIRHHHRNPLEPRFQERVQGASAIGMRALMAPPE